MHPIRKLVSAAVAVFAATLIACGGGASDGTATSSSALGAPAPAYLALGDSISFGYNPLLIPPKTSHWFVGFPSYLGELIDAPMVNAACPGQTSSGFISLAGTDNGCFTFRASFDLHVDYDGSQLAFAEEFLAGHPRTRLITLQLGANDLLLQFHLCNDDIACVTAAAPQVIQAVVTDVAISIASLRAAGYDGQIIMPNYYAPFASFRPLVMALNAALAQVAGATGADVADVFSAFDAATAPPAHDPCAAGLLITLPGGGCDQHPSQAGALLIAETIAPVVAAPAQ